MSEDFIPNKNIVKTFKLSEKKVKNEKIKLFTIINIVIIILFMMEIFLKHSRDQHSNLIFLIAFISINIFLLNSKKNTTELTLAENAMTYNDCNRSFNAGYNEIKNIEIKRKSNNSIYSVNLHFDAGILILAQNLENIDEIIEIIISRTKIFNPEINVKNCNRLTIFDKITLWLPLIATLLYFTPYAIYVNKIFGILFIMNGYSILNQKYLSNNVMPIISSEYETPLGILSCIMGICCFAI